MGIGPTTHEGTFASTSNTIATTSSLSNRRRHVHPIYLQHDGHSRTIVGYETGKTIDHLLIFDPGTRANQVDEFIANPLKSMRIFRRGLASFKKSEYQLLIDSDAMIIHFE